MLSQARNKHIARIIIGVVTGLIAIYADKIAPVSNKATLQMIAWTFALVAFMLTEFRYSLNRRVQKYIILGIIAIHFVLLYVIRNIFPFQNFLEILLYLMLEITFFGFVYFRLGQSLDPAGPFGMREEERNRRAGSRWKV